MSNLSEEIINRYLTGQCSEEELIEVNAWISESDENARQLFRMEEIYHLGKFDHYADEQRMANAEKRLYKQLSQEKKKKDKVLHMHRWMRYAAILAVALLMGGGAGYWFYNRPEHQMLVAVANEGIVKEVVLPDGTTWTPRNSTDKREGEMVTLKWGLANSDNWITARLMSKLNPYELKRLLHSFGVRNREIVPSIALCLGPCEISVGEMVSAYTAFPNKGIRVAPMFVTRIEDSDGNVLATFSPEMEEVVSVSSAYKMLVMLRAVINEGTGGRVRRLGVKADMGGKTGTTNYNADGWFMGFTPSLVSGCWVGGEERDIHFDGMTHGQGASMALPIWSKYMVKVLGDKTLGYDESETFQLPEGFDPCKDNGDVDLEPASEIGLDDFFD